MQMLHRIVLWEFNSSLNNISFVSTKSKSVLKRLSPLYISIYSVHINYVIIDMFYCCVLSALLLLCVKCRPSENKVKIYS